MKRTGLITLLLVCFLISMPVVAADLELAKGEQVETFLLDHQVVIGQQITTNVKGEVVFTDSDVLAISGYENIAVDYSSIAESRLQHMNQLIEIQNNEIAKQYEMLVQAQEQYNNRVESLENMEVLSKFLFGLTLLF